MSGWRVVSGMARQRRHESPAFSLPLSSHVRLFTYTAVDNNASQCTRHTSRWSALHTLYIHIHTHNRLTAFGTTRVSQYQKGKTNLDFTEARDSEWQWHQLGHMQVCTSLQTDNHASTPPLSFYRTDTLHAAQPTASKHWRQYINIHTYKFIQRQKLCERIWGAGKGWLDGKGRLEKMEF